MKFERLNQEAGTFRSMVSADRRSESERFFDSTKVHNGLPWND